MVTPSSFMEVKSDAASRPGRCSCVKNTCLAEPCRAFHRRTRRSKVRRIDAGYFPGCVCWTQCQRVLAWSRGSRCNCSATAGHTSAKASGQVRQLCGWRTSCGSWPHSRYLRAVFLSMLARIAAVRSGAPWARCLNSSLTWAAVTRRDVPISNSFRHEVADVVGRPGVSSCAWCSNFHWGKIIVAGDNYPRLTGER